MVDDRTSNRLLLVKLIEPLGFEVREAENGAIAVELWESCQPDLIRMDMRMPVINGDEATKEIKAQPKGQATTIIPLSASVFDQDISTILSAGCDDLVRKHFRENTILEQFSERLEARYLYQETGAFLTVASTPNARRIESFLFPENLISVYAEQLKVMPLDWSDQLKLFAQKLDNKLIIPLLEHIPEEPSDFALSSDHWVENFRYDMIVELTKIQ